METPKPLGVKTIGQWQNSYRLVNRGRGRHAPAGPTTIPHLDMMNQASSQGANVRLKTSDQV